MEKHWEILKVGLMILCRSVLMVMSMLQILRIIGGIIGGFGIELSWFDVAAGILITIYGAYKIGEIEQQAKLIREGKR